MLVLSPDQIGRELDMRRTNVAREFTRLQQESRRAVEILGQVMAELGSERIERRRPARFARRVQRLPVITYSRKT